MGAWFGNFTRRRMHADPRRPRFVPACEPLEERCLLSAGYGGVGLISDVPGLAAYTDPGLVNPWAMSYAPGGEFWFTNNRTGLSTLATGTGSPNTSDGTLTVTIEPTAGVATSMPTGTVFNHSHGFNIAADGKSGPGLFLFATEEGTIAGWNPLVDLHHAVIAVDHSDTPGVGPVYTGLTIAQTGQGTFLYAADFRTGQIDVFDRQFQTVHVAGGFQDPQLPADFVPFNVQFLGGSIYVAYTQQDGGRYDGTHTAGVGAVDVFSADGRLQQRLATGGALAAPWGLTLAPSNFGAFSNALLVGNFGDGRINAFDPATGQFLGSLTDDAGQPLVIPGLWGLTFGNNGDGGSSDTLYFVAGIENEHHGLFGAIEPLGNGITSANLLQNLAATQSSAEEGDDYPLPPSGGPTLQYDISQQAALFTALLPLQERSLAVVPTLLAESASPVPLGPSLGASANPYALSPEGSLTGLGQWYGDTDNVLPGERDLALNMLLDLSSFAMPAEPGRDARLAQNEPHAPPQVVATADIRLTGTEGAVMEARAPAAAATPALSAPETHRGNFTETEAEPVVRSEPPVLDGERPARSTFLTASSYIALAVLLGCAAPWTWYRRRGRPQQGFFRTLWPHSTQRQIKTVRIERTPLSSRELPVTASVPVSQLAALADSFKYKNPTGDIRRRNG